MRGMPIEITERRHFTPTGMAVFQKIKKKKKKKKNTGNKCWRTYGETGSLAHCCWECKMLQLLWKTVWWFIKTIKYTSAV